MSLESAMNVISSAYRFSVYERCSPLVLILFYYDWSQNWRCIPDHTQPQIYSRTEVLPFAMSASAKTLTAKPNSLSEEWTVILPRRGKRRARSMMKSQEQPPPPKQPVTWAPTDCEVDSLRESKLMQKMQTCMKKLESSQFLLKLLDQVENPESDIVDRFPNVLGSETVMPMVIYGIGSIESYENPRLQLSLALLLKRKFSWIGGIEVFDPVLSATESRVLESLGCSVLSVNEQGRRKAQKPTLFFMPHCEAELYDNLLQENWSVELLKNIALLGNSFENYEQHVSLTKNSAVSSARHIFAVREITDEFKIDTVSDDYFGAFHDSSWHFFSPVGETGLPLIISSGCKLEKQNCN